MPSLFSKSSAKSGEHSNAQIYSFVPTQEDEDIVRVSLANQQDTPVYTAKLSTKKSPDVLVWRGSDINDEPIARAAVDMPTCTADVSVHGTVLTMKTDMCYGSTIIEHPKFGKLKWKVSSLSGKPSTLVDGEDNEIAKHKTIGMHYGGGPRELTLLAPGDADFLDVVVLTVLAARRLSGIAQEKVVTIAAVA